MSSILLVLLITFVIVIERVYRFWFVYDISNTDAFLATVQKMIINNSIENSIRLCKQSKPKLVPFVLSEGLKRANDSVEEINNAMDHATLTTLPKINSLVAALGTNANIATLLGLLGTIFGLIKSFGGAATATGAEKQTILAEGISEALTATSFGLTTALICLLAHGILSLKQQSLISDINSSASKLIDLLHTRKLKIKTDQ